MNIKRMTFVLPLLFVSCNKGPYAKETIDKLIVKDNQVSFMASEKENNKENVLKNEVGKDDFLYSPICLDLIQTYQKDKGSFSSLYQKLNQKKDKFRIEDTFSVASSNAIEDKIKGVSYFEGTQEELKNSLSKFYQKDISIVHPGTYYLTEFNLKDQFLLPKNIKKNVPFVGKGKYDYVEFLGDYSYYENDVYEYLSLPIHQTELRILLPKNGIEKLSYSDFYQEETSMIKMKAYVPKFDKKYSYVNVDTDCYTYQNNTFHFDEYGIEASSFTVNGPTAIDPAYQKEIIVDHPFLFSIFYDNVMLMTGKISSLDE